MTILLGLGLAAFIALLLWRYRCKHGQQTKQQWLGLIALSVAMFVVVMASYGHYGQPDYQNVEAKSQPVETLTVEQQNEQYMKELQDKLTEDTQNGELWYALGNVYMYRSEFENAALAFSYAARLAERPQANIYAAQATAQYYANKQHLTPEVNELINKALAIDEFNTNALMVQASSYFLDAEYQQAINSWQKALDGDHSDVDRASVIRSIHQAEQLLDSGR